MSSPLRLAVATLAGGAALGSAAALGLGACTQTPIEAPLRSLHSLGPMAFVCLDAPSGSAAEFALPLEHCSADRSAGPYDYSIPHLYALVTQPLRGEVAVVDLTTDSEAVLDQDPDTPGANFLPIGAQPTDIVATPGGMVTFVATAEPNFERIFALPSDMIRRSAPRLSS